MISGSYRGCRLQSYEKDISWLSFIDSKTPGTLESILMSRDDNLSICHTFG